MGTKGLRVVAAAMAGAALLAACSSSSHSSNPSATTSPSSSGGSSASTSAGGSSATGAPLKVGVICTCSGTLGASGVIKEDVYKAWANTVNATGGVAGHPVKLVTKDDAGLPGNGLSDATTLVSNHVDAILDISNVDTAWQSTVSSANIPVVGSNLFDTPFNTNPDFYSEGQTEDSANYSVVATAKQAGAKNLGVFYCAEAAACQTVISPVKAAGKQLGIPVGYVNEISATAPNYTAQCLAAKDDKVTAVFIADVPNVVKSVGPSCDLQGYDPIWVTEGSSFNMLQPVAAGLKKNLWSEFSDLPFFSTAPAVEAMDRAVDKYYPGLRNNPNSWSQLAALSWPSGLLLADAVKQGGLTASATPSAAEVVTGLHALKGDTLDGWAPPLTFAAGKPNPVDCWFVSHVSNGTPSMVDNGKATCESGTGQ